MSDSKKRRKVSQEFKSQIINEFINSSLSVKEICAKHDIKENTFKWWIQTDKDLHKVAIERAQQFGKKSRYTFEQRKTAVEAYLKSGLNYTQFAKVYGTSVMTISVWTRIYQEKGPQGLASEPINKYRGRKPIPDTLKKEIVQVKTENPRFGLRKVRDFLKRFKGVKVSHKTVGKTLKEQNIEVLPVLKKRRRSSDKVRRFERAKPMQLWQSDITSYVLTRHSQRVYLTVFIDDHSRYVVAWNLQLRQTNDLVIDALLNGIQKFGKPEEVLTDQGRQYFAWRGRSDFRKVLDKEGINHVVSRSHHPQTLGKCERLWETIKNELWDRAKPQELTEARERLKHFFNHYNHFRPHQGLDGMTPADRFFGLENEIRKQLEATMKENALRLALGESPRAPVFLIGQIGNQSISLHGESGELVLNTPDGETHRVDYKKFGHLAQETADGKRNSSTQETWPQTRELQSSTASGDTGTWTLGVGLEGGAAESSSRLHTSDGILDGTDHEARNGNADEATSGANLAVVTTGDIGNASRPVEATENANQGAEFDGRGKSTETKEEDRGAREAYSDAGSPDRHHARDARLQGCESASASQRSEATSEEAWPSKEKPDTEGSSS